MDILPEFIEWHFFTAWGQITLLWRNLSLFPFYYFSISHHLNTLFSPWKRQTMQNGPGFHPDEFFSVLIINIFSRLMGASLRLTAIFFGILLSVFLFSFGLVIFIIWPVLAIFSLPFYLSKNDIKKEARYCLKLSSGNLKKLALHLFSQPYGQFVGKHLGLWPIELHNYLVGVNDTGDIDNFNLKLKEKSFPYHLADLFQTLAQSYPPFTKILVKQKTDDFDVYKTAHWYFELSALSKKPLFFDLNQIRSLPGIGADWAYGYTVELDKFSTDLSKHYSTFPLLIGRDVEIEAIERVLIQTEANNVLLVGEPGVSRHIIVESLAHRIKTGRCPLFLSHKRIISINMHALVSSFPSINEVKGLLSRILKEAEAAGNIIAVVDDFDRYISSSENKADFSDIFTKFTQCSIGFIGITTPANYHKYVENNISLFTLFQKVDIVEPSLETVKNELLLSIVPALEKKYQITITYQAVNKAISDSQRFITDKPFPAKSIDLLDQSAVLAISKGEKNFLLPRHIDNFLEDKLKIPLGELNASEKNKLIHLEELMHEQIINQNEAISAIASALRRSRLEIASTNRPIGSFLFLGPTGVGKTETAKALSRIYFGSEDRMLRFDMSQYQSEEGLERLIGSSRTQSPGEFTSKLKDHPYTLLLLDEFEKCSREIFNLFLTLFDEGYISDARGNKINAKNTIIIATSNAGSLFIRNSLIQGMNPQELQQKLVEEVMNEHIFSPELINRFDEVVVFSPLSEGHLREVARLMLHKLNERLKPKEVSVAVTPDLIRKLAHTGFDEKFGARAMQRVMAEKIESQIANKLLGGNVKKGEVVQINL